MLIILTKKTLNSHYGGCKNLTSLFVKSIEKFIQIGSCMNMENRSRHKRKFNEQKTYSFYGKAKLLSTNYLLKLNKNTIFQ